jgi:sialidase-1
MDTAISSLGRDKNDRPVPLMPQIMRAATTAAAMLTAGLAGAAPSETAPLRKLKDVVIYSDERFHCAFPSLVLRPDGDMLCAFRRAPSRKHLYGATHDLHTDPNSYLELVRSKDLGNTWTKEPEHIFAHPFGGSQDPCMLQLRDGSILCASYGWAQVPESSEKKNPKPAADSTTLTVSLGAYKFLGGWLLRSADGARTWSRPIIPPPVPDQASYDPYGNPVPSYNRGALLEREDGSILWAIVRTERNPITSMTIHIMKSTDRGDTWRHLGQAASDPKVIFNETSLVELADGRVAALLRTASNGGRGGISISADGGKTFTPWKDMGFIGEPYQGVQLADGRVLLVYGYRQPSPGIRAKLLAPDLSDVTTAPEFVIRNDGGEWDLGYPWAVVLPDGKLFVAYYINIGGGTRHIAGSLLEIVR